MNYISLLFTSLLFLPYGLLAEDLKDNTTYVLSDKDVKAKVKVRDGMAKAKIYLAEKRMFKKNANKSQQISIPHYAISVKAKVGNKDILDAYFSPNFYLGRCRIKFKFKDFSPHPKNIDFIVNDKYGEVIKKSFPIKRKGKIENFIVNNKKRQSKKLTSKIWTLTSVDNVVKKLYGERGLKIFESTNSYNIEGNCSSFYYKKDVLIQPCGGTFVEIDSSKQLSSVAVLNLESEIPLMAFYNIPVQSISYIEVRSHISNHAKIIIMAEDTDGKIYKSKLYVIENSRTCGSSDGSETIRMNFKIK